MRLTLRKRNLQLELALGWPRRATPILQKVVLVNPIVYASEGLRGTLVPQFPHLPVIVVFLGLVIFDVLLLIVGLRQFRRKAET